MDFQLRLRHPSGDIGPFAVSDSLTVAAVKDLVFAQWPCEGALAKEPPACAADLRLLCAGKFLDNARALKDYRKEIGDIEAGSVVTMHVLVRPAAAGKAAAPKEPDDPKKAKSGCSCVIC